MLAWYVKSRFDSALWAPPKKQPQNITLKRTKQVQSIRREYIPTDQAISGSFNRYLLYHIWSIFSHFPPGCDAPFTEGVITVGQDPKDIISRHFFINIVHANSTGYRCILPRAWGSSRTIVLFCCVTGNRLLGTHYSLRTWLKWRRFLVKASRLNTWGTFEFCSNGKSVPRGDSESVKKVSQ